MSGTDPAPAIELRLPPGVRDACGGRAAVSYPARDVAGLLAALRERHPEAYRRLCDEQGRLRQHLGAFVNETPLRALRGLETQLSAGDVVTILPAVSGG